MISLKRMSCLTSYTIFFAIACIFFVPACAFTQCKGASCSWFSDSDGDYLLLYNDKHEPVRVYVRNKKDIQVIPDSIASNHNQSFGDDGSSCAKNFSSPSGSVYYSLLNESEKQVYMQIYQAILEQKNELTVYGDWKESIFRITWAVLNDHPEFFWLKQSVDVSHFYGGERDRSVIRFAKYQFSGSLEKASRDFENETQKIIRKASMLNTDYEKERFVHDYLVQSVRYDLNCDFSDSAYSAIVNKVALCDGIAKAFQYIMTRLGIKAWYVPGKAVGMHGSGEHAWNQVRIGSTCHNVDVTFDKLAEDEERGNVMTLPAYFYFNLTDDKFREQGYVHDSKTDSDQLELPPCQGKFSYQKTFSDGVGEGYYKEFALTFESIIRNMRDFYAQMRLRCRQSDKPKFKTIFVVTDEKIANEITDLSLETVKKEFAREAYEGNLRDYEFYGVDTTKENVGGGNYLVYLTMKYRKLKD